MHGSDNNNNNNNKHIVPTRPELKIGGSELTFMMRSTNCVPLWGAIGAAIAIVEFMGCDRALRSGSSKIKVASPFLIRFRRA